MSRWAASDDRGGPPEPGWFTVRLVRHGPHIPAQIDLDEGGLWSAIIDGKEVGPPNYDPIYAAGVYRVWHGGKRVQQTEYEYLIMLKAWALKHSPSHPLCNPRQPIDIASLPPIIP